MACGCSKNRAAASGKTGAVSGTYRVYAGGRKVYETTDPKAAGTVAAKFQDATVLAPGEAA